MGVKERKERDRKLMHELILKSAHQLFLDRGFEAVSIRNIADAIEYSPAVIYLYIKDKREIFYSIQGEAFKAFNVFIADVTAVSKPFDRLVALAERYVQFTFQHPRYYSIMFMQESPSANEENSANWIEGSKTHHLLHDTIEACRQDGYFTTTDTNVVSFSIWSFMHGMCSLALRNRLRIYPIDDREAIRQESFRQFIRLLKSL